jgi:hypothetical protein
MQGKIGFELLNIDRENESYNRIFISETSKDLEDYILQLRTSIIDEKETRMYNMRSETTEVVASVMKILEADKNLTPQSEVIAKRLLKIEVETQDRYDHIAKIKKGSLFITKFIIDGAINILIVKIEHSPFIDESDLKKHIGLPFENEVLKSCLFQFDEEQELISILAHDSNGIIATYWWNTFLELEEISSDVQNTKSAFNAIDSFLSRKIRPTAPSDYTLIRNNLIGYFRTTKKFGIKKMVETVIGDYELLDKDIDIDEIKKALIDLPVKRKFDSNFSIVSEEINARIRKTIKINESVDIRINDFTEDLKSVIHSVKAKDGKKYVQILADDDAYEKFKYGGD